MKDQRWANRPDAVAKRPNKQQRIVFVLVVFVLVAGALLVFDTLGGERISASLAPASGTPEARDAETD